MEEPAKSSSARATGAFMNSVFFFLSISLLFFLAWLNNRVSAPVGKCW